MKKEIERVKEWIKDYVHSTGKESVVLGLSGGVDSAVVAALAIDALGSENVMLYALPCLSDSKDLDDATMLADFFEKDLDVIDLSTSFDVMRMSLGIPEEEVDELVCANIKSRLRMVALYAMANDLDALVIGTTNKSEMMIGYVTKGGDGMVDFEPIGDFWKGEVVDMGMELGLPQATCYRRPTAGLQSNVTDELEIGMPYTVLDPILMDIEQGKVTNMQDKNVKTALVLVGGSMHKRRTPPVFKRS